MAHTTVLLAGLLIGGAHSGHAAPLTYAIESEVQYDSELRARDEGLGDTSLHVRGTLQSAWRLGPGQLQARLGADLRRFDKETRFDQETLILGIDLSPAAAFRNSRVTASGKVSYDSTTRSDPILGDFIQSEQLKADVTIEYDPNSRVTLSLAPSYFKEFPETSAYADQRVNALKLGSAFALARGKEALFSIDTRESTFSRSVNADTETLTFQAGWHQDLNAAFIWSLSGGLQSWKRHEGNRRENPFVAARIHWRINESSHFSAQADHGLQVYLDNTVNEGSRLSISLSRDFNQQWKGILSVAWLRDRLERLTGGSRNDEGVSADLQIEKALNKRSSANLYIEVSDRDSTEDTFSYGRLRTGIRLLVLW